MHLGRRVGVIFRKPHVEVEHAQAVRRPRRPDYQRVPAEPRARRAQRRRESSAAAAHAAGWPPAQHGPVGADQRCRAEHAPWTRPPVPGQSPACAELRAVARLPAPLAAHQCRMSASSGWAKIVGTVCCCTSRCSRISLEAAAPDMAAGVDGGTLCFRGMEVVPEGVSWAFVVTYVHICKLILSQRCPSILPGLSTHVAETSTGGVAPVPKRATRSPPW